MKRNNGGYVLVYVMVVIVILCILVPAACSNSLQNLKAQQASIERMQQLYTAEGKIEQFYAEIETKARTLKSEGYPYSEVDDAIKAAKNAFAGEVFLASKIQDFSLKKEDGAAADEKFVPTWSEEEGVYICKLSIASTEKDITIEAKIKVALKIETPSTEKSITDGGEEKLVPYYNYKITDCTITYESYDISATTEGEGENQS